MEQPRETLLTMADPSGTILDTGGPFCTGDDPIPSGGSPRNTVSPKEANAAVPDLYAQMAVHTLVQQMPNLSIGGSNKSVSETEGNNTSSPEVLGPEDLTNEVLTDLTNRLTKEINDGDHERSNSKEGPTTMTGQMPPPPEDLRGPAQAHQEEGEGHQSVQPLEDTLETGHNNKDHQHRSERQQPPMHGDEALTDVLATGLVEDGQEKREIAEGLDEHFVQDELLDHWKVREALKLESLNQSGAEVISLLAPLRDGVLRFLSHIFASMDWCMKGYFRVVQLVDLAVAKGVVQTDNLHLTAVALTSLWRKTDDMTERVPYAELGYLAGQFFFFLRGSNPPANNRQELTVPAQEIHLEEMRLLTALGWDTQNLPSAHIWIETIFQRLDLITGRRIAMHIQDAYQVGLEKAALLIRTVPTQNPKILPPRALAIGCVCVGMAQVGLLRHSTLRPTEPSFSSGPTNLEWNRIWAALLEMPDLQMEDSDDQDGDLEAQTFGGLSVKQMLAALAWATRADILELRKGAFVCARTLQAIGQIEAMHGALPNNSMPPQFMSTTEGQMMQHPHERQHSRAQLR